MKVLRFYAPKDVRIEDAPEPDCGPDEVKLRVRNCSTCGTDVKILKFGHHHIAPPRVMGHEIAGEITEVGAEVTGWRAGDRVRYHGPYERDDVSRCKVTKVNPMVPGLGGSGRQAGSSIGSS